MLPKLRIWLIWYYCRQIGHIVRKWLADRKPQTPDKLTDKSCRSKIRFPWPPCVNLREISPDDTWFVDNGATVTTASGDYIAAVKRFVIIESNSNFVTCGLCPIFARICFQMILKRYFRFWYSLPSRLQERNLRSNTDLRGEELTGRSTAGVECLHAGGAISRLSHRQTPVAIYTDADSALIAYLVVHPF